MSKRLTVKDLIAKKEDLKARESKTADLFIKSLGGNIKIQRPTKEMCLDALEMKNGNEYLVYHCVVEPNMKDKELRQSFGCVEPIEIVDHIFEPGEIAQISTECVSLAGYGDSVKLVSEVKN